MNDQLEQQIAHAFSRTAAQVRVQTMRPIAEAAIRRGQRLRRGRQAGAVAATAAVIGVAVPVVNLALGADGSTGPTTMPGGAPITSMAKPTPTLPSQSPSHPATTPCTKVTAPPPDTEVDTVMNNETGILQFFYTVGDKNYAYTINIRNDPTCQDDPALRRLIQHVLDAYTEGVGE